MSGYNRFTRAFHTQQAIEYGTKMVGQNLVQVELHTLICQYLIVLRIQFLKQAQMHLLACSSTFCCICYTEAIEAKIDLIVCITEGIPVSDMVKVKKSLSNSGSRLIVLIVLNVTQSCKIGVMPGHIHKKYSWYSISFRYINIKLWDRQLLVVSDNRHIDCW